MKLRNKLILSCAALAAVATTAVSTTFAWYTSNVDVSANGITASSQESDSSTLLISKTGAKRSWGAKAEFDMATQETGTLVPVTYASGNYYTWDQDNDQASSTAIDWALSGGIYRNQFLSFIVYFKSGTTDSLEVGWSGITITNTTTTLPGKTLMTNEGLAGVTSTQYTVDILRALRISTNAASSKEVASGYAAQYNAAQGTQGQEGYVPAATVTRTTYQLETNYHTKADSLDSATSFNAHTYYDTIKGTTISEDAKATAGTSETAAQLAASTDGVFATPISLGTTGAGAQTGDNVDNVLAVRFDVYLDGWDTACFDACQGQTFTIALNFGVITA